MLIALDIGGEKGYNRGMGNTMNAKFYKTKRFFKSGLPYFLACGLVLGVYLFMLILRKVYPFGPYTVASYDLSAQICPFIEHIFDVWKGRSTPLFSYAIGTGADMFGSLAYFIFSPFSPLFLIFGEGMVAEAAGVVVGCKLLTLAAIGVWFARTQFGLSPLVSACLGVLYAYCGYTFVSNTYINWMDLLMYTPFAVWAFKKMLKTGSFWLFSAFISACIYTSFSIACFSMFTVYPVLVAYAFICVKKEERAEYITRLSLAFACAILMALPVLVPSLIAYLRAGRGGSFFEDALYGFEKNGFLTEGYLGKTVAALEAKLSYIFTDGILLVLTCVYFFRSRLKTRLSKFMLVAGIFTLIPVIVDESMLLLNMGSYMSYALRFGFLNSLYFYVGACMGLQGLTVFEMEKNRGPCIERKKILPIVYGVACGVLLLGMTVFFGGGYHIKAADLFEGNAADAIRNFAGRFAHSIGGIFAVTIYLGCVLLILGVGAVLVSRKKLPMRLVGIFTAALVVFHGVFFNQQLVDGNYSSHNIRTQHYTDFARTLEEQDDGFYRIRDYGNYFSANIGFEGDTYAHTAFSSMLDKNNFPVAVLFGYSTNGKNISRGNGGNIFGESLFGYKYVIVPSESKEEADKRSWYKPVMVEKDGESQQLSAGGMYVYENLHVFPTAMVIDNGEYRFVADNETYPNRVANQMELYRFLGGDKEVEYLTGGHVRLLSQKLWKSGGEVEVSAGKVSATVTAKEGQYLMVPFAAIEGYRVFVNGQEAELCDNDLSFLCVALQEGENAVEFVYESPYDEYMLIGFATGLMALILVWVLEKKTVLFKKTSKVISVLGIGLAGGVVVLFFLFPIRLFLSKWVAMLFELF